MTTVKERPILFSGPMVRAILSGAKTQTRRVIRSPRLPVLASEPDHMWSLGGSKVGYRYRVGIGNDEGWRYEESSRDMVSCCPYGKPGDRLWVRETWALVYADEEEADDWPSHRAIPKSSPGMGWQVWHRAGHLWERDSREDNGFRWRPSIHMPRWASRITLEITGVRVERLQDISEENAAAEGVGPGYMPNSLGSTTCAGYRPMFARVWRDINGPDSWAANPWVWVIEFKRIEGGGAK